MPPKKPVVVDADSAAGVLWRALKTMDEDAIIAALFQAPTAEDAADEDEVLSRVGPPRPFATEAVATAQKDGTPPLLYAAQNRAGDAVITLLLAAGADPNHAAERGERQVPLIAACWGEDDQVLGALLGFRKRAEQYIARHSLSKNTGLLDLTARDAVGRNCFHVCCLMGCHVLLTTLVDHCIASSPTKGAAINVLSNAFLAQDTSDLSTPLHKALEQVGNGDRRYSQCAADVLSEVLGIEVIEEGTSPVTLRAVISDSRVNGDSRHKILTAVDRAGDTLLHTLAFAVVGVPQCAVFYRRLAFGVLAGCGDAERARELLTAQNEESNTAVHCLCENGADFRGTIESVLRSAVEKGILTGLGVWEFLVLDADSNGQTPLSTAAVTDGASSLNESTSGSSGGPSAFLGVLDVLQICTGDTVEGQRCRGFDLKGNPFHKSGVGRALLAIGLKVAARTGNEDIEASLSSKQLMAIKEKVIHKYVGGVLHNVLLGKKYQSLFFSGGLSPAVVRELEEEVVLGAAKMAATPLLQARAQGQQGCCSAPSEAHGDTHGDDTQHDTAEAPRGDFSGVGADGPHPEGSKVQKAKDGPSVAAQILVVILLLGMVLPLLDKILPKLGF